MKLTDWIITLLPAAIGYTTSRVCPNVAQTEVVAKPLKAQPPGWVFGVVWPLLYLSIGYCWMMARKTGMKRVVDLIFVANLVFINAWIWFYGCKDQKDKALWTFVPSIATAIMMLVVVSAATKSWWPAVLIAPYIAWLIFASQLNFARVNQ
jgi:tryptophan-rich sensory protein